MKRLQKKGGSRLNKYPRVSIIIPAYNIEAYVGNAIESALAQTWPDTEIIVVDDGSTDETARIIQNYDPDRVRYLYQENRGLPGARNTGIRASSGQWIALLDGDDEWFPERLEKQLTSLLAHPDLVWGSCNHEMLNVATGDRSLMKPVDYCRAITRGQDWFESFFLANLSYIWWPPSTMMIARQVFDQVGLFREGLRFAEDIEMWWRIAYRWPQFGFVCEPLVLYHQFRPDSLTVATQDDEKVRVMCELFDEHLELAGRHGCYDGVRGFVDRNIRRFVSQYYQAGELAKMRQLLKRYRRLLPGSYRWAMAVFTRLIAPGSSQSRKWLEKIQSFNKMRGYEVPK